MTASDGSVLPGVTVEARSDVLPGPRVTITAANGEYRLPALPPGTYTLTFTFSGMQSVTRSAQVQLAQDTVADAALGVSGIEETVTVTAEATPGRPGDGDASRPGSPTTRSWACRSARSTATCRS